MFFFAETYFLNPKSTEWSRNRPTHRLLFTLIFPRVHENSLYWLICALSFIFTFNFHLCTWGLNGKFINCEMIALSKWSLTFCVKCFVLKSHTMRWNPFSFIRAESSLTIFRTGFERKIKNFNSYHFFHTAVSARVLYF